MLPSTIMVATDGSEPARAAEIFGAELAGAVSEQVGTCEVLLVTVVRHRDIPTVRGQVPDAIPPEELAQANEVLNEAYMRVGEALTGTKASLRSMLIEAHSPAVGIVEAAQTDGCSLIVMGNRGHGGLSSLVLGSVSTQVLHGAHCPVVVVK